MAIKKQYLKSKPICKVTFKIPAEVGKAYQFRYVLDKIQWENETEADKFVPSPYGDSDNSVIIV